ncbi:Hypothetical_protein [Hexamita inflata]|uniref:Hypothetical_protein n=1 Tax=Hexamita inflata TaxID=28002 RepID=A0AA86R6I9_9EUKA|nr:Hypothetical protein HINF_LOCUS59120 [Hexamita inflata]
MNRTVFLSQRRKCSNEDMQNSLFAQDEIYKILQYKSMDSENLVFVTDEQCILNQVNIVRSQNSSQSEKISIIQSFMQYHKIQAYVLDAILENIQIFYSQPDFHAFAMDLSLLISRSRQQLQSTYFQLPEPQQIVSSFYMLLRTIINYCKPELISFIEERILLLTPIVYNSQNTCMFLFLIGKLYSILQINEYKARKLLSVMSKYKRGQQVILKCFTTFATACLVDLDHLFPEYYELFDSCYAANLSNFEYCYLYLSVRFQYNLENKQCINFVKTFNDFRKLNDTQKKQWWNLIKSIEWTEDDDFLVLKTSQIQYDEDGMNWLAQCGLPV